MKYCFSWMLMPAWCQPDLGKSVQKRTSDTGVSNVFGLVQTAVKLKNKLFIRHQCRVCDSVSGKIIGNMVTDQCNKCQRKQGCNQKGNQEFCLK